MSNSCSSIDKVISDKLEKEGKSIRNKAAFGALVKLIPVVGDSLLHALTAGDKEVKAEKQEIQLDLLCKLVQKIDVCITEMLNDAQQKGAPFVEVSGTINVRGEGADNVTGIDVSSDRSVSFKPGTVVNVEGKNSKNITGVKI
ncbi:hypothetical protein EGC79_11280 [Shewanella vesiculosa]|uniref:hypothetical protein n=1 Tax=Shewanella vesiculosa TaxID=518738 RepID=UPI000F511629|nr:hypothetical protein [Shewanella vesiculosa]RPA50665.1 hypothetical protein EGC79_11280 [Shewanella vesiculosa]UJL44337.1 hypothetical protein KDH10_001828 [Shewanella vesiculosa]